MPLLVKSIIDQYSLSLFSTGVPDIAMNESDFSDLTAFVTAVVAFFIACASSITTRRYVVLLKSFTLFLKVP